MNVGQVIASSGIDLSGFKSGAKNMEKAGEQAAKSVSKSFDRIGKSLTSLGSKMTTRLTLPIVGMGTLAVKTAKDFEDSFADIRKTVTATEAEFSSMKTELIALSKTVPTPIEELNRLAGVAGQLGVENDNIVGFTKVIAMLGDATDIASEQAALSLSRFMNVMGTAQGDIDRVGSTVVGLGNNFAAMESEIVDIGTSLASFGSQMRLSEHQVLAFATAIAASGGESQAASTAFQKTASTMQQAVIEGNKDLETFAKIAGVSAATFAKVFREDAAGALQMFLKGLKDVSDRGESTASVLAELGLADQRLQREFGKLIGNLGQLDAALKRGEKEWESNTALVEEAQKRYETFASELGILKNSFKSVGRIIGADLIPFIRKMIDSIQDGITWFESLSSEVRRNGLIIAGILGAAGPILGAIGVMSMAFAAVSAPVLAVVAGIGLAAALIITNWDKVASYFTSGGGAQMWDNLKSIVSSSVDLIVGIWEMFGDDLIKYTEYAFGALIPIIETTLKEINNIVGFWAKIFTGDFKGAFGEVTYGFKDMGIGLKDVAVGLGRWLWFINPPRIAFKILTNLFKDGEAEAWKFGGSMSDVMSWANDGIRQTEGATWSMFGALEKSKEEVEKLGNEAQDATIKAKSLAELFGNISAPNIAPIDEVIDPQAIFEANEQMRFFKMSLEELMSLKVDIGDVIFPPDSLGDLQSRLQALGMELRLATDPEHQARLREEMQLTQEQINSITGTATASGTAMMGLANALGQVFSQAVLHARDLQSVLTNLLKQLTSKAFVVGIGALLTGGTSLAGGSFLGAIFGGLFHGGGVVPGTGERMIKAKGGEMVLTTAQQNALGGMIGGRQESISPMAIERGMERALSRVISGVSDNRIFELSERGRRGY